MPGHVDDETFISTYVRHLVMANNELDGAMVASGLTTWVMDRPDHRYAYRSLVNAESNVAISYCSCNLEQLKAKVIAGFQVTCIGDERRYTYLTSGHGNTAIMGFVKRALRKRPNYVE